MGQFEISWPLNWHGDPAYHGAMLNRSKKSRSRDTNVIAYQTVLEATGQAPKTAPPVERPKNPHAVALGRLGGLKGGKARAANLSRKKRSEIAEKAAKARWTRRENV